MKFERSLPSWPPAMAIIAPTRTNTKRVGSIGAAPRTVVTRV